MRNFNGWRSALSALIVLIAIGAGLLALFAGEASAAEPAGPLAFDPILSLTGDCTTSPTDEVPDPGCPYEPTHQPQPFSNACGVATDSHGDLYVASSGSASVGATDGRIDIFDPSGHFLQEIANPNRPCQLAVDPTGALYVQTHPESRVEIDKYVPNQYPPTATTDYGSPSRFEFSSNATALAVDPDDDHVYVADARGIEVYAPDGTFEETFISPSTNPEVFGGLGSVGGLAVWGKNGDVYVSGESPGELFKGKIFIFDGTTHELKLTIPGPPSEGGFNFNGAGGRLAVDQRNGDVYVADISGHAVVDRYRGFGGLPGAPGDLVEQIRHSFKPGSEPGLAVDSPVAPGEAGYDSPNEGHAYITSGETAAHLYAFEPPSLTGPPTIADQAVSSITDTEAVLRGRVNPSGLPTTYRFEYVDDAQFQASGYAGAAVAPVPDGQAGAEPLPKLVSQPIAGLSPGTLYHYRLVASNEAGTSTGEAGKEDGLTFGTYPSRAGLPDGRAYELVTPPDSNGLVPIGVPAGTRAASFNSTTVSPNEDSLVYAIASGAGSLPGLGGNGTSDTYEAIRTADGWSSRVTSPSGAEAVLPEPGGFSADHRFSLWLIQEYGGSLDPGIAGMIPRYLRFPDGSFEFLGHGSLGADPRARGLYISPDGDHIIFDNGALGDPQQPLETDAPPAGIEAIYDREPEGPTKVVSLLPGDVTPGAPAEYELSSTDGSSVLFTITEAGITTLYERRNDQVTVPIVTGTATPVAISSDGGRVLYLKGGNLFACDPGSVGCVEPTGNAPIPIGSGGETQVVNVSADGSHAYFVSGAVLTGGVENDNGETAEPGANNFYAWSASGLRFVGKLAAADVTGPLNLASWVEGMVGGSSARGAGVDPSRSTPDGSALVFASHARLSSTANGGQPEIYRFDDRTGNTQCLSCGPTGGSPEGTASLETIQTGDLFALLGTYTPVANIADDGTKVFFQSEDPLVLGDTNETLDVYEWEEAGTGGCQEGGPAFNPAAEGCVFLISSGHSPTPSYLYAASPSGNDVFFRTASTLVPQDTDGGAPSIYDARVGGGFSAASTPAPCNGEGCKSQPLPAPGSPLASSESFQGPGSAPHEKKGHKKKHAKHRHKKKHTKKNAARELPSAGRNHR